MLDISKRLKTINDLLEKGTTESLTYATLECRLTLEYICYERFKSTYPYLSADDLKAWQPSHVVKQVAEDVNDQICNEISLSVSVNDKSNKNPKEYALVGTQAELNLKKIHSLWHALSNKALHIPVPTIGSGHISIYGEPLAIKSKIQDVIDLLSELSNGNLLIGGCMGRVYNIHCESCDTLTRKPLQSIKPSQVVNCIKPSCRETYLIEQGTIDGGFTHMRRVINMNCSSCSEITVIPTNMFKNLKFEQHLDVTCNKCGHVNNIEMRPCINNTADKKIT